MIRNHYRKNLKKFELSRHQLNGLLDLIQQVSFQECRTLSQELKDGLETSNNLMFHYFAGDLLSHDAFEDDSLTALIDTPKIRSNQLLLSVDSLRAINAELNEFFDGLTFILDDEQVALFVNASFDIARPHLLRLHGLDKNVKLNDYFVGRVAYPILFNDIYIRSMVKSHVVNAEQQVFELKP